MLSINELLNHIQGIVWLTSIVAIAPIVSATKLFYDNYTLEASFASTAVLPFVVLPSHY